MLLIQAIFHHLPSVPKCPNVVHSVVSNSECCTDLQRNTWRGYCLLCSLHDNHNGQSYTAQIISDAITNSPRAVVFGLLVTCTLPSESSDDALRKINKRCASFTNKFIIATLKFGSCLIENLCPSVIFPYAPCIALFHGISTFSEPNNSKKK